MIEVKASDDIIAQVMNDRREINAILYGEITFTIQDGRLVSLRYERTKRVGKEITRNEKPCAG
jgi:hypothetical protein